MTKLPLALTLLLVSTPALADVGGGCRCDSGSLAGLAVALPLVALGALLARRVR